MRSGNEQLNTARAVASSGTDFVNAGTLTYATQWPKNTSKGWYALIILETAEISSVTFVDKAGNTLTPDETPTWVTSGLTAGFYISAGFIAGEDAYISAITFASGKGALYLD